MDDLTKRSKVKLMYGLPDEVVEDYTYEMSRLKFKVKCLLLLEALKVSLKATKTL